MEGLNTISGVMTKHHHKLEGLMNIIKIQEKKDSETMKESFNRFKWELQKHFFIEEKAILQLKYFEKEETNLIKNQLKGEHVILEQELDKLEQCLEKNEKIDLSEFKDLLSRHRNFEDDILYPRLDRELDQEKKKLILDRIKF
jgi:hypothetical protein